MLRVSREGLGGGIGQIVMRDEARANCLSEELCEELWTALDGAVRDLVEIRRDYGFPVYARDVSPGTTLGRYKTVASQVPVCVGDVIVHPGDLIVVSFGEPIGKSGGTNTMKIVRVGEHRRA